MWGIGENMQSFGWKHEGEVYNFFGGQHQGKRSLVEPRYRWKDNVKFNLRIIYCEDVDWIDLA